MSDRITPFPPAPSKIIKMKYKYARLRQEELVNVIHFLEKLKNREKSIQVTVKSQRELDVLKDLTASMRSKLWKMSMKNAKNADTQ